FYTSSLLQLHSSPYIHRVATATATLSLHDALPISNRRRPSPRGIAGGAPCRSCASPAAPIRAARAAPRPASQRVRPLLERLATRDRKSTRLNSSHVSISYAVFCLKKKKIGVTDQRR